jgi:hypothetical protein
VCFATGKGIQPYYLEYEHAEIPKQSKTNLNWPEQGKPDKISFRIWKRYLRLCFLSEMTYCPKPMGTWNIKEILKTSPREAYYSTSELEVYIAVGAAG